MDEAAAGRSMRDLVELEVDGAIATLTLSRPEKRNAISDGMREGLVAALVRISHDPSIRALVLTGRGNAFCAGGDIASMQERMDAPATQVAFNGWTRQQSVHQAVAVLHSMQKPTIAAVNGAATGLGADMALCCDFVMVSATASLAWTYIQRGLVPDGGGMYLLPRRVGLSRAKELIFSGRSVDANEALLLGIADRVCRPESLLHEARAWALQLSSGSPAALGMAKSILDRTFESTPEQVFAQGSQAQAICYTTAEHRNAVNAFLKRTPAKGRGV